MKNDDLIGQLQLMAGGSLVMSTDQLAKSLSMNPKVISRMRQENRFPIAHKTIGSKIVYAIVSVANYLLSDEIELKTPSPVPKIEPPRRRTGNKAQFPDLTKKMLRIAFIANLEQQKETIEKLTVFLNRKIQHDELKNNLHINSINGNDGAKLKI